MHARVWFNVGLLGVVLLGCGGKQENTATGGGAAAGSNTAGSATAPVAGTAGSAAALNEPLGGAGGASECVDGFQPLRVTTASPTPDVIEAGVTAMGLLAWPSQQKFAVSLGNSLAIYDVSQATQQGVVTLEQLLLPSDFGLTADAWFGNIYQDGEGLVAFTSSGPTMQFVSWQPATGGALLTEGPSGVTRVSGNLADAAHGLVISDGDTIYLARKTGSEWTWSTLGSNPHRSLRPLAFDNDALLVGMDEIAPGDLPLAQGGEGGAGGAASDLDPVPHSPHVQRWSLSGEVLSSWHATGNPRVAFHSGYEWFIGETNGSGGSHPAAVESINGSPFGDILQPLAPVPVISAADGEDGAMGLAELAGRVLVANCESGLGRIARVAGGGRFEPIRGPWTPTGGAQCNPRKVAVIGNVLATAGARIDFARTCE